MALNIFASNRITPASINFPKPFDKVKWDSFNSYSALCSAMEKSDVGAIVIDTGNTGDFNGLRLAKALTEITCDRHTKLPTLLVIGPNPVMKKQIEDHLAQAKRWIDLNRGK